MLKLERIDRIFAAKSLGERRFESTYAKPKFDIESGSRMEPHRAPRVKLRFRFVLPLFMHGKNEEVTIVVFAHAAIVPLNEGATVSPFVGSSVPDQSSCLSCLELDSSLSQPL